MKKGLLIGSALLLFTLLPSCGRGEPSAEPGFSYSETAAGTTEAAAAKTTVPAEPVTEKKSAANKTYGKSKSKVQDAAVLDTAVDYRTTDSYRFEAQAVAAARNMLCETLFAPQTLNVKSANVWNCVDDGENVYYSVHMDVSYKVESGDQIERGYFCDVGVCKADGSAFDAADSLDSVVEKYSVYTEYPRDKSAEIQDGSEAEQYENAAAEIAGKHLKFPDTAKFISVTAAAQDEAYRQYDVQYEAANDYGMRVSCLYSAYLVRRDGRIFEVDPTEM